MPELAVSPNDAAQQQRADDDAMAQVASSFTMFLAQVKVEREGAIRRFHTVADPWQWDLAELLAYCVEWVAQTSPIANYPPDKRCFWVELPKGHNKTSLGAAVIAYLIQFGRRQEAIHIDAVARNKQQADELRLGLISHKLLNPNLLPGVRIPQAGMIRGPGGRMRIMASDEFGAHGSRPHVTICDEVTVWDRVHGSSVWTTLESNYLKRRMLWLVLSNAGYEGSWQEKRYKEVCADDDWTVYTLRGKHASWIDDAAWEKARRNAPGQEAVRLYDNRWTQTLGNPLVQPEWIGLAERLDSQGQYVRP